MSHRRNLGFFTFQSKLFSSASANKIFAYVHVCFRAARARRKRTAGGAKRIDQRTADPERRGLKDELESRGIQYSSKEGTAALRRKLQNGA